MEEGRKRTAKMICDVSVPVCFSYLDFFRRTDGRRFMLALVSAKLCVGPFPRREP